MTNNIFGVLGAAFGFLGVALGAFGAHALKAKLTPDMLAVFETGVKYQMYHALALLAVHLLRGQSGGGLTVAGWFFSAGILLFSGSLYILAFTGVRAWAAVTPVGGLCLLAGWAILVVSFIKK
jgi:uncharacterized membrane protein YgdD (TMEM256/DUF423 family)